MPRVPINGIEIDYQEYGEGEAIVFCHGAAAICFHGGSRYHTSPRDTGASRFPIGASDTRMTSPTVLA